MARINIEEKLYSDQRFHKLILKLGGSFTALGALAAAWTEAQKWWVPDQKPIPEERWQELELPEAIIECKLATRFKDGVKMRGIKKQFEWLISRSEAARAGGKRSAEMRRQKYGSATPINATNHPNGTSVSAEAPAEAKPKLTEPSFSSSFSFSKKIQGEEPQVIKMPVSAKAKPVTAEVTTPEELSKLIDPRTIENWRKLYDDEYLKREIIKAVNYYNHNSRKKPRTVKGWKLTLGSWFERGWARHAQSIKGSRGVDWDAVAKEVEANK